MACTWQTEKLIHYSCQLHHGIIYILFYVYDKDVFIKTFLVLSFESYSVSYMNLILLHFLKFQPHICFSMDRIAIAIDFSK